MPNSYHLGLKCSIKTLDDMKKHAFNLVILALMLFAACTNVEEKNYLTLSGAIGNPNADTLSLVDRWGKGFYKKITVDANGIFKDTLRVETGYYIIDDGTDFIKVYLKNGEDLDITYDAADYETPVNYEGTLAPYSNCMEKILAIEKKISLGDENIPLFEEDVFNAKMKEFETQMLSVLDVAKNENLDSTFIVTEGENIKDIVAFMNDRYEEKQFIVKNLPKGLVSPSFSDYENHQGGNSSLEDFRGAYVFIDFWATWCGPCIAEVPSLQKLEEKYHDKNIKFVSISIDRKENKNIWKNLISEENFPGTQLFANEDKGFEDAYKVSGIPRFILLDPEGKIVDADAPRPSSEDLVELLDGIL